MRNKSILDKPVAVGGGSAATVTVDTSAFDYNLGVADNTVQKALDTIDDIVVGGSAGLIATPNDGEVHMTPKVSSSGVEGTMFYCSDDNYVYVGVE